MARRRGRPPKTPLVNSAVSVSKERSASIPMDLAALDDADLDTLSPKQAEELLECLDGLRSRLKQKDSVINKETSSVEKDGTSPNKEGDLRSQKLQLLGAPLRKLNRLHFAQIDKREVEVREQLEMVQNELVLRPFDTALHLAEKDLTRQYDQGAEEV
ncbi:hypothetical protein RIF29_21231 [Crotalaria pallida]|uniref:Uncharacterized protein n=1 Tax=Crotalaria pallida TaxID=3830 RepID=A0AAN9F688_CROPI